MNHMRKSKHNQRYHIALDGDWPKDQLPGKNSNANAQAAATKFHRIRSGNHAAPNLVEKGTTSRAAVGIGPCQVKFN